MSELALCRADTRVWPLRVALLGYRSNPFSGGQGVYLNHLSRALVDAGHNVDVISGEPYPHLDERVRLVKLPGLNLFAEQSHVTALRPRHLLSATDLFEWFSMLTGGFPEPYTFGRRLVGHLARTNRTYDLVHDNQSLCYGLLRVQRSGMPLVCTIHHPITWDKDIALNHATSWGERLLIKRWHNFLHMQANVARRVHHIVTVSERSRQDISSAFNINPDRVRVIYNGIDTDAFHPEPGIKRNPWQIITTASADQPLKGTQYLIPAFARLLTKYPRLKLIFIGNPKPGGPTERLIKQLNIGDRIQFMHGITTEQIRFLYAGSSLAVVPSEYEGFGLPAGEAMACGIPVVSTDGGGLPEVVGDAAVVVPAKSSEALANAMADLLENPSMRARIGHLGREHILARFSWQRAAGETAELYREALT
ncbi:MAG: glycosyltransferase family 4 protein [Gammaproteobacteria bacterium]|nr:glycosyltransferase family 4 protein [Gammaproteobacteria bacterium]